MTRTAKDYEEKYTDWLARGGKIIYYATGEEISQIDVHGPDQLELHFGPFRPTIVVPMTTKFRMIR